MTYPTHAQVAATLRACIANAQSTVRAVDCAGPVAVRAARTVELGRRLDDLWPTVSSGVRADGRWWLRALGHRTASAPTLTDAAFAWCHWADAQEAARLSVELDGVAA